MKRSGIITAVAALLLLAAASAQSQGRVGVGVIVGDPTGIAWNWRMNTANSLSGGIGTVGNERYRFHVDYLWITRPFQEQRLGLHYGAGGVLGTGHRSSFTSNGVTYYNDGYDEPGFGVRGVVGLTYTIADTPLDVFLEAGPVVKITPGFDSGLDLGLGMRVYP